MQFEPLQRAAKVFNRVTGTGNRQTTAEEALTIYRKLVVEVGD